MQYLGGKSRLGKHIAQAIRAHGKHVQGTPIWEPFCGGLGCTPYLATLGPIICSDVNPALISLYRAVRAGWVAPDVDEDLYRAAKALPDSDPLKAFAGFGCSFGGKYFGGYARQNTTYSFSNGARNALSKQVPAAFSFDCWSFFDQVPQAGVTLYLDPPYAETTGYSTGAFDNEAFWLRAEEWSKYTHVYVSEFKAPEAWLSVWECERGTKGGAALRTSDQREHMERLFYRGPLT